MANEITIKTFETILAEIEADLLSFNSPISNTQEGGAYDLIKRISALIISDFYVVLEGALDQGFVETATGTFLDQKAQEVSLLRNQPTKAKKLFTLKRSSGVGVLQIAVGDVIKSPTITDVGKLRWLSIQEDGSTLAAGIAAEFLAGVTSIDVTFEADDTGSGHNNMEEKLGVSQVTMEIESGLAGVDGTPPVESFDAAELIPGTDLETDEDLRGRIKGQWTKLAAGSTEASYINFALESSPSVESASAIATGGTSSPTQVTVTAAGGPGSRILTIGINAETDDNFKPNYTADGLPGGTKTPLGDIIHSFIRERIPLTDFLFVKPVIEVPATLTVNILVADGFDKADTKTLVGNRFLALFIPQKGITDVKTLEVGENILHSRLTKILNNTPGVEDFTITAPGGAADLTLTAPANEKVFTNGPITVGDL